jgi:hypothetical protein
VVALTYRASVDQPSCPFSIGWDAGIHPDFIVWLITLMLACAVEGGTERRLIML